MNEGSEASTAPALVTRSAITVDAPLVDNSSVGIWRRPSFVSSVKPDQAAMDRFVLTRE